MQPERIPIPSDNINTLSEEELKNLRRFLFEERISLINERRTLDESYEKFLDERLSFREEMEALNSKVLYERKRLKDEEAFFDKKMMILQNGFAALEMDRKSFERQKAEFEREKSENRRNYEDIGDVSSFFIGVTSYLGLKKRYKDLMKIFHPDTLDGDNSMAVAIKNEFEMLKDRFL